MRKSKYEKSQDRVRMLKLLVVDILPPVPPVPPVAEQSADSSPSAAIVNLFLVRTAALSEIPSSPVGVPVSGRITLGLE